MIPDNENFTTKRKKNYINPWKTCLVNDDEANIVNYKIQYVE